MTGTCISRCQMPSKFKFSKIWLTFHRHNAHADTETSFNLVLNPEGEQSWHFVEPASFEKVMSMAKNQHGIAMSVKTSFYPKTSDLLQVSTILLHILTCFWSGKDESLEVQTRVWRSRHCSNWLDALAEMQDNFGFSCLLATCHRTCCCVASRHTPSDSL
jgi:hypothetical protein